MCAALSEGCRMAAVLPTTRGGDEGIGCGGLTEPSGFGRSRLGLLRSVALLERLTEVFVGLSFS